MIRSNSVLLIAIGLSLILGFCSSFHPRVGLFKSSVRPYSPELAVARLKAAKEAIPYPGYGKKKRSGSKGKNGASYPLGDGEDFEEGQEEDELEDRERPSAHSISQQLKLASEERINKVLARAGIASRRGADDLVLANRVLVNGNLVNSPGFKVDVKKDIIVVDGQRISLPDAKSTYWVAINKPKNVITSMNDDQGRETLSSLVPKSKELRLVPVGRLERDATGLMILTNEVGWIHPMTHRSFKHHNNRYEVVVQGLVEEEDIERLKRGSGQSIGVRVRRGDIGGSSRTTKLN